MSWGTEPVPGAAYRNPYQRDYLAALMFFIHMAVIGYVAFGWLQNTRGGLFVYCVILPFIVMTWLFNQGSSIVTSWESLMRSGYWHDTRNPNEGAFFETMLARLIGIKVHAFQINLVVLVTMSLFWITALVHMILIVPKT